jgi:hypothetical protein
VIEHLYLIRCEGSDSGVPCQNWNGSVRSYPERDQAQEDAAMLRMGWALRPDLCPEHRAGSSHE